MKRPQPRAAHRHAPKELGAAAVLALAAISAIITLTVGGLFVSAAVLSSHRARLAADLAAIAGATALRDSAGLRDGCVEARRVAAHNGSSLVECRTSGGDVEVVVEVRARPWPAVARSRAGPASVSATAK